MKNFVLLLLLFLTSCNDAWISPDKNVWINFDDKPAEIVDKSTIPPSDKYLRIAVASMTTPDETIHEYNDLFNYLEERLDRDIILFQRKTYKEVNQLLKKNDIDLAFICSGAYVSGTPDSSFKFFLLPERDNQHYYFAYIIVKKDSPYHHFSDLKGKNFVFSDSLSNTGMFYPLKRLHDLHTTPDDFFAKTSLSNAHNNSIELVNRGLVDAASVNSLIFDYIMKTDPEKVANLRIIEKSKPFGMPPLVVSNEIDPRLKQDLYDVLTNMVKNKEGRQILRSLMINRFVTDSDTLYDGIRQMKNEINGL